MRERNRERKREREGKREKERKRERERARERLFFFSLNTFIDLANVFHGFLLAFISNKNIFKVFYTFFDADPSEIYRKSLRYPRRSSNRSTNNSVIVVSFDIPLNIKCLRMNKPDGIVGLIDQFQGYSI